MLPRWFSRQHSSLSSELRSAAAVSQSLINGNLFNWEEFLIAMFSVLCSKCYQIWSCIPANLLRWAEVTSGVFTLSNCRHLTEVPWERGVIWSIEGRSKNRMPKVTSINGVINHPPPPFHELAPSLHHSDEPRHCHWKREELGVQNWSSGLTKSTVPSMPASAFTRSSLNF